MAFSGTPTSKLGLPQWNGTDLFSRVEFNSLMTQLDSTPGVYVCSSTTRPTLTAGQAGRLIYQTDTNSLYEWTGSAWRAVLATPTSSYVASSMRPTHYTGATNVTISATANENMDRLPDTGTANGCTFTAPPSGTVLISVAGTLQSGNTSNMQLGWYLRFGPTIGSGNLVTTGNEANCAALVYTSNDNSNSYMMGSGPQYLQTGLSAGATYNVTFGHRNAGGAYTRTITHRRILIIPQP